MYTNLAIDFGVGLIPIVGDFADAWFKCNTRNNLLLERFLRERGATNPAPPPPPKQSAMRRWFGPGPNAPGSQPGQPVATASTTSQGTAGNTGTSKPTAPVPPPKDTTGPKLSGRGVGTDGGKGVVAARERDLEAQKDGGQDVIHYRRED